MISININVFNIKNNLLRNKINNKIIIRCYHFNISYLFFEMNTLLKKKKSTAISSITRVNINYSCLRIINALFA